MNIIHRIQPIKTSTVPARFIYFDSEAHDDGGLDRRTQTFRCAVTCREFWSRETGTWARATWRTHRSVASLWDHIDESCAQGQRTVLVAHNLGYDLRICRAFEELPVRGWSMNRISMGGQNVSAIFRKGTASLSMIDSMSWLPMALQKIAALLGTEKVPLPAFAAGDDEWEHRCRVDVEILRAAMRDLWDWIRSEDLGAWTRSGAGMAWNNWRHRHFTHRPLVYDDDEVRRNEGASCYAGRCEAWRHGLLSKGEWTEYDLPMAYPMIARDALLPTVFSGERNPSTWKQAYRPRADRRQLYHCRVTTDVPTLPAAGPDGFYWPVGTFSGWWWDVEVDNALAYGATFECDKVYMYRAEPALAQWAEWIIDYVRNGTETSTPVRQAAAKHWSRALIGRFAMQYTPWDAWGPSPEYDVDVHGIFDMATDRVGQLLTLGDRCWIGWERQFSRDACPAMLSAVMAEARVRLWSLMMRAGLDHVAYVDTDSLLVDRAGADNLVSSIGEAELWGLRFKQTFINLTVKGPRQRITEGMPKVSGIPKGARSVGPDKWIGDVWESLPQSLRTGRSDRVVITPTPFQVKGRDTRRLHLPGGLTAPITVGATDVSPAAPDRRQEAS